MKIKIRKAKIVDIPSLVDKMFKFYDKLRQYGARDIARDDNVLRGGVIIEIGMGFSNPNWHCVVAVKDTEVVAFMIGMLEYCQPIAEHDRCVRIHADYLENDTLAGPRILTSLWNLIETWAQEHSAEFFYTNIHPGNQPSVRAAKSVGFKHHYTQFYRPITIDKKVEE